MTRILIVDDDHGQLRVLARVISMRRRDLTILTASHGLDAIEVLQTGPVDLVLTDLQMPEMNGFELLGWIVEHQPHVPVYSMTAYPAEAGERLSELGSIECFTKPLDIPMLLERISSVLASGARGHVRNIGLPSFLQLLEMERKTCTLTIESGGQTAHFYLRDGVLVHAKTRDLEGQTAATSVLSWRDPAINIVGGCAVREQTITLPTSFLIMESMRLFDEAARSREGLEDWLEHPATPTPVPSRVRPEASSLSRFPVYLPADARAIALIEVSTGRVRTAAGHLENLDAHAEMVTRLFRCEVAAVARLKLDDSVEELVVTTAGHWTLIRPVAVDAESLVLLVFDPAHANLVMERRELATFVRELETWCAQQRS